MTVPGEGRRVVGGRYRLGNPIGRGGAGVVWSGHDEVLWRPVAVKEIFVPFAEGRQDRLTMRSRVLREARALARLDSPAIVTVFDVVEETHRHWIVMELVEAQSLAEVIREAGSLPPARVAAIGLALTEALGAAHSVGILHRDVKPGNILLARDGRVRLTDFGIATTREDTTLTGAGALVGSPAYIAPERIRGASGSPASDLWGLAATLYAAVEGYPPFEGSDIYAVLRAVAEGHRRPFVLAGPLAPPLTALLDREPHDRPSLAQIRRWLRPIAGTTSAVPASLTAPLPTVIGQPDQIDPLTPGPQTRGIRPPASIGRKSTAGGLVRLGEVTVPRRWPAGAVKPAGPRDTGGLRGPLLASAAAAAVIATTLALSGVLAPATSDLGAAAAAAPAPRHSQPFAKVADASTAVTATVGNDQVAAVSTGARSPSAPRTTSPTTHHKPPPSLAPAQPGDPATEPAPTSPPSPPAPGTPRETPSSPTSSRSSAPPDRSAAPSSPTPTNPPDTPTATTPPPTPRGEAVEEVGDLGTGLVGVGS